MVADYVNHLPSKMRSGATGFMMVGDFDKYNRSVSEPDALQRLFSLKRYAAHRYFDRVVRRLLPKYFTPDLLDTAAGIAKQGEEVSALGTT